MKTIKDNSVLILGLIAAILSWALPGSIFYGLLIGTISVIALIVAHIIREHWSIKLLVGLCVVFFYGIAVMYWTSNFLAG